jgi:hypothetical protein
VAGSFTGAVALINGATGEEIWTCPSEAKIFTVRPIGDVNGDGVPDIIAGQQYLNGLGGKFFVISGGTVNPIGIDDLDVTIPEQHLLISNYPNPFNASTIISYSLSEAADVSLEVFNLLGQRIDMLYTGRQEAGTHKFTWNVLSADGSLPSGVYYCRISAGNNISAIKMTVLK